MNYAHVSMGVRVMRLLIAALAMMPTAALAIECPTPGQPCKWLSLSPQEEQMLIQDRGILQSAAEARKIDLDTVTYYFRKKIEAAPQGEVKSVEQKQGQ